MDNVKESFSNIARYRIRESTGWFSRGNVSEKPTYIPVVVFFFFGYLNYSDGQYTMTNHSTKMRAGSEKLTTTGKILYTFFHDICDIY